jgi:hypothetical protein
MGNSFDRMKRTDKGRFLEQQPVNCPWCGGHVEIEDGWSRAPLGIYEWNGSHFAQCQECGARGPDLGTRLMARQEWDRIAEQHQLILS